MNEPFAKRSLGQNFLISQGVIHKILQTAQAEPGRRILEIGPGRGALTNEALARGADLLAIEKDDTLAQALAETHQDKPFQILNMDFLDLDLTDPRVQGRNIMGNLPYNVSVAILGKLLQTPIPFPRMVLMFQKEVADRIAAQPGTKDFGIPTLMAQLTHKVKKVATVPPTAFRPAPKIHSAVLLLEPLPEPILTGPDREAFINTAANWFRFRRKTLRQALLHAGSGTREKVDSLLEASPIDPQARLETIGINGLVTLWKALQA